MTEGREPTAAGAAIAGLSLVAAGLSGRPVAPGVLLLLGLALVLLAALAGRR